MEQWNMTNPELHELFFEKINSERYSLNQALLLSYLETCLEEHNRNEAFITFKENIYSSNEDIATIANQLTQFGYPTLESHKKKYVNFINQILSCTLEGLTLSICRDSDQKSISYELTKADLLFFNYLFVTRYTENAKKLLDGKYDCIDDDYYELLRTGIENLISTHPNSYTIEDIEICFEYKFGRARKNLLAKLGYLNDITQDIAFGITTFSLNEKEVISIYRQCATFLEEAENKLMMFKRNIPDDSRKNILAELGITVEGT